MFVEAKGKVVRPKVIASTATIRKAGDQVHATFLRTVNVFPPNGIDVKDNFFALQRSPSEELPVADTSASVLPVAD